MVKKLDPSLAFGYYSVVYCKQYSLTLTETNIQSLIPIYLSPVSAGFPSPATDYVEKNLDLNQHLVKNPAATFLVRADGESMLHASINPDDILVVDRSLTPKNDSVIVACLDGDFTVKHFRKINGKVELLPDNPKFPKITVSQDTDFEIWGVVTHVIHSFK
ncbi:MAG: translesion error-prone DNA polymerase V autoproteolytic subunit [Patescibacteria group bacterium]|nr:translesion error-prone DNA polymerase V autoproteolytic subunit [Patescibacteria group bacterium]